MNRRGSILIIVTGLSTILLVLSVTFLALMRGDSEESILMVRDSQARIMLASALEYLQETSRLGWRSTAAGASPLGDGSRGYECYGWTDVRDGSIGPRGPRIDNPADVNNGRLPVPTWWSASWPAYPHDDVIDPQKDPQNAYTYSPSAQLPGAGSRRWPCPGSAMRGDMYVMRTAPYAVRATKVYNPVTADPADDPSVVIDAAYNTGNRDAHRQQSNALMTTAWKPYLDQCRLVDGVGMLDPQPVNDTWTEFRLGDRRPRGDSTNLGWFRVYRELPSDHDANADPWFDHVALQGHGVFIIACGAGASMGYRFWSTTDPGFSRDLEPVTAQESGVFPDEDMFRQIRGNERILWYRAEWTAMQGGGANAVEHYSEAGDHGLDFSGLFATNGAVRGSSGWVDDSREKLPVSNTVASFFGAIKWIQRLEKDPQTW
ncbi:MAG: hypothetical protein H0V44_02255 [Planctomycetes bacterium]|nr:hypothetical protein [Planctomycetota bacterium]